jgi:hypothetical protein
MAMYHAGAVRIPKVFHYGDDGRGGSYIIMEHLALGGGNDQTEFGRAMAKVPGRRPWARQFRGRGWEQLHASTHAHASARPGTLASTLRHRGTEAQRHRGTEAQRHRGTGTHTDTDSDAGTGIDI